GRMIPDEISIGIGRVAMRVRNRTEHLLSVAALFLGDDNDTHPAMVYTPVPFLSGARLLTSQTFRDRFPAESVASPPVLHIRNVSLLCSALQASTAPYGRVGDLRALELVRQHFDVLGGIIRDERGAVVKTIGDAVMAVFGHPHNAMAAAVRMNDDIAAVRAN